MINRTENFRGGGLSSEVGISKQRWGSGDPPGSPPPQFNHCWAHFDVGSWRTSKDLTNVNYQQKRVTTTNVPKRFPSRCIISYCRQCELQKQTRVPAVGQKRLTSKL